MHQLLILSTGPVFNPPISGTNINHCQISRPNSTLMNNEHIANSHTDSSYINYTKLFYIAKKLQGNAQILT